MLTLDLVAYQEFSSGVFIEHNFDFSGSASGTSYSLTAPAAEGLRFNFNAESGTPQSVIDGFLAAGALWSNLIHDDATININISFPELPEYILGSTGTVGVMFNYSDVYDALSADRSSLDDIEAVSNLQTGSSIDLLISGTANSPNGTGSETPYLDDDGDANNSTIEITRANAKSLGLVSSGSSSLDANIAFSSEFDWDFDPSNGVTAGHIDFIAVAAHEIGHALGFISGVDILDLNSPNQSSQFFNDDLFTFVSTLDLFRFSDDSVNEGSGVIDWSAETSDKFFSIDGGNTELASFSTGRMDGDGEQASHWKDNLGIGLMDPTLGYGESGSISNLDLLAMDVIGWDVVDPAQVFAGDNSAEDFVIRVSPSNNSIAEILVDSVQIGSWAVGGVESVNLSSSGGIDTLTIDYSHGNPLPNAFVRFHGGADSDTLTFLGTSSADDFLMESTSRNFTMEVNSDEPTEFLLLGVQSVVVDVAGGTDELVVDWGRGSPIPSVGLTFPGDLPPESFLARDANGNETTAYMVNRTSDTVDAAADGVLDVDLGTAGRQISLRAAVRATNNNGSGTVFLPDADFLLDRTGTADDDAYQGDLDITANATIVGVGAGGSVIKAGGSAGLGERVFHVISSANLLLSQVTVRGGYSTSSGGGIRVAGTLTLTESAIVANASEVVGGGIYSDGSSATVTILDSVIAQNDLENGSASNQNGGAGIYATSGSLNMGNTIVANNTADTLASGGAYDVYGGTTVVGSLGNNLLESVRSSVEGNFALGNDLIDDVDYVVTSVVDGNDSGISPSQRSLRETVIVADDDSIATIWVPAWQHKFMVTGDDNNNTGGDLDFSGDITMLGIGAGFTIIDAGGDWGVGDRVLDVRPGGELNLSRATLTGGNATASGGGIRVEATLVLEEVAVVGNDSEIVGGGIYNAGSADTTVLESVIAYNHLTNGGSSNQNGGAGIYATAGELTLDHSIVGNNTSDVLVAGGANDIWGSTSGVFTSGGDNLLEDVRSTLESTFSATNDLIGSVSYIVTSIADTFDQRDNIIAFSLREAIDRANNNSGEDTVWVPGWTVRLTRNGSDSGSPNIQIGDIDILDDVILRGVSTDETILDANAISDDVFEEIGGADLDSARLTIDN